MATKKSPFKGLARTEKLREAIGLHPAEPGYVYVEQNIQHVPFFKLSDEDMIGLFQHAFEPELARLKAASPTVEATEHATIGNLGPDAFLTPSCLIYDADYAEVNRAILGVSTLR